MQAGILPVDLRSDLALRNSTLFFGTAKVRVGGRHRIIVEGSPLRFEGRNTLSRTIVYNGRTYTISDQVESEADLTYFFAGYQWDFIARERGTIGLRTGGAYLGASGTIRSSTTSVEAGRSYRIGVPLAGLDAQAFLIPDLLELFGGVQGMPLGGFGRYVQAWAGAGVLIGPVGFRAGYRVLDADVHERGQEGATRTGVAPRIAGPVLSLVLRVR
jgi:hypothetical protein